MVETVDPTSNELLTVKLRYKAPDGDKSRLLEVPLAVGGIPAFDQASRDFQFAAAVAAFGMKLAGSPAAGISAGRTFRASFGGRWGTIPAAIGRSFSP